MGQEDLREFWPKDGERVEPRDRSVIVKVAEVSGNYAQSRWLMTDGVIYYTSYSVTDAGGGRVPARWDEVERLAALLQALPPSDPAAQPNMRMVVAFPVNGQWVVRTYRGDAKPKGVADLARAIEVPAF